jgi:hypothetical protein
MYPKELLKHRFYPYGSQAPSDNAVFSADVEMATANAVATDDVEMINVVPQPKEQEMKDKGRKRRGDDVTPKKAKKVKRAA